MVLIPAIFLTSCKKAAPDLDISELQPEDEVVTMQEEALDNSGEVEAVPTESAEQGDEGQETSEVGQEVDAGETGTTEETGDAQPETVEETTEPEPTSPPEPVATPEPVTVTPGVHIVQIGETLFRIAVTYGTTVEALSQANSITNPSLIYPGQELTIPAGSTDGSTTPPPVSPGGTVYVVQQGDNLFRIGLRFGVDQYYLARYNGIANVSIISVGQEIRIP